MYLNLHTSCAMSLGESKSGMFFYNQPTYMADSDRSYSEENASCSTVPDFPLPNSVSVDNGSICWRCWASFDREMEKKNNGFRLKEVKLQYIK
jgi:hypothetical protein